MGKHPTFLQVPIANVRRCVHTYMLTTRPWSNAYAGASILGILLSLAYIHRHLGPSRHSWLALLFDQLRTLSNVGRDLDGHSAICVTLFCSFYFHQLHVWSRWSSNWVILPSCHDVTYYGTLAHSLLRFSSLMPTESRPAKRTMLLTNWNPIKMVSSCTYWSLLTILWNAIQLASWSWCRLCICSRLSRMPWDITIDCESVGKEMAVFRLRKCWPRKFFPTINYCFSEWSFFRKKPWYVH